MKRLVLALLLVASSASAEVYTYPANYFPSVGDTVTTASGTTFEITGSCTITNPGTGSATPAQLVTWGVVPCHDFVMENSGTVNFLAQGTLVTSPMNCVYQEFFHCPAILASSSEVPLDMSKAISFLLGGLTGLGFVLASSSRW